MSRFASYMAEALTEVEREYCWYIKIGDSSGDVIKRLLEAGYTALYQKQAQVKAPSGSIRVRSEISGEEGSVVKYTQTIKEHKPKTDGEIPTSLETTLDIDADFYSAFVNIVGEEMCKVRFLIPYSDKEGAFWEVDIFTDGDFNPLPYAKVDLEISTTVDEQTTALPVEGEIYPANEENKGIIDEINARVKVPR